MTLPVVTMAFTSSDKALALGRVLGALSAVIVLGTYAYGRWRGFSPWDSPWFAVTLLLFGAQSFLPAKSRLAWAAALGAASTSALWLFTLPPGTDAPSSEPAKRPEPAPDTVAGAASHALGQAAKLAAGCHPKGGPVGTGKVRVAYAQNGSVESVDVLSEEFRDGVTGSCLRTAFRRAQIPAFSGPSPTFIKAFSIRPE